MNQKTFKLELKHISQYIQSIEKSKSARLSLRSQNTLKEKSFSVTGTPLLTKRSAQTKKIKIQTAKQNQQIKVESQPQTMRQTPVDEEDKQLKLHHYHYQRISPDKASMSIFKMGKLKNPALNQLIYNNFVERIIETKKEKINQLIGNQRTLSNLKFQSNTTSPTFSYRHFKLGSTYRQKKQRVANKKQKEQEQNSKEIYFNESRIKDFDQLRIENLVEVDAPQELLNRQKIIQKLTERKGLNTELDDLKKMGQSLVKTYDGSNKLNLEESLESKLFHQQLLKRQQVYKQFYENVKQVSGAINDQNEKKQIDQSIIKFIQQQDVKFDRNEDQNQVDKKKQFNPHETPRLYKQATQYLSRSTRKQLNERQLLETPNTNRSRPTPTQSPRIEIAHSFQNSTFDNMRKDSVKKQTPSQTPTNEQQQNKISSKQQQNQLNLITNQEQKLQIPTFFFKSQQIKEVNQSYEDSPSRKIGRSQVRSISSNSSQQEKQFEKKLNEKIITGFTDALNQVFEDEPLKKTKFYQKGNIMTVENDDNARHFRRKSSILINLKQSILSQNLLDTMKTQQRQQRKSVLFHKQIDQELLHILVTRWRFVKYKIDILF